MFGNDASKARRTSIDISNAYGAELSIWRVGNRARYLMDEQDGKGTIVPVTGCGI